MNKQPKSFIPHTASPHSQYEPLQFTLTELLLNMEF